MELQNCGGSFADFGKWRTSWRRGFYRCNCHTELSVEILIRLWSTNYNLVPQRCCHINGFKNLLKIYFIMHLIELNFLSYSRLNIEDKIILPLNN